MKKSYIAPVMEISNVDVTNHILSGSAPEVTFGTGTTEVMNAPEEELNIWED